MSGDAAREAIISLIYETLRTPRNWPRALEQIGAWLGADCGLMLAPKAGALAPVPLFVYGLDLTAVASSYPRFAGRAELTQRALNSGRAPGVFVVDELITPEEQPQNAFWQEVILPLGIANGLFGLIRTPEENNRPIVMNFYRRADGLARFSRTDAERFQSLLPDLRRVLSITLDAPDAPASADEVGDVYNAIAAPCFLFDSHSRVVHANHAATLLAQSHDGLSLQNGALVLSDESAQKELQSALARIVGSGWSSTLRTGAELLAHRPSGGAMVVVLTPLGADNPIAAISAPVRCALFVLEEKLRANGILPDRLRRLYGLTAAETTICLDLAAGLSLTDISKSRGTSVQTVRSQVKTALSKTGARRQADLAMLVNRLRY